MFISLVQEAFCRFVIDQVTSKTQTGRVARLGEFTKRIIS